MYARRYQNALTLLGLSTKPQHALNKYHLEALNISLPKALYEYYRVAGTQSQLSSTFNRLLPPSDLVISQERLVFMEENQAVVCWGLPIKHSEDNPIVEQALNINGDFSDWHSEGVRCADFLLANLYWHASFGGGLEYSAIALTDADLKEKLDTTFPLLSQIGKLSTYGCQNCAMSYIQTGDDWHLYGGFQDYELQASIGQTIGVKWQDL